MKKYIRTKDHIYKRLFTDEAIINELGVGACDKNLNPLNEDIVKESDTIEELCDEFVWDEDLCHIDFERKTLKLKRDDFVFSLAYCSKSTSPVYGAIWTDKGLQFVARMNEKGELELL